MTEPGLLIIISAPSGTGKSTLCRKLISNFPSARYSVSLTTRAPRRGEVQGKDYFFVSKNEFKQKIKRDELAEWALVHGHYYGTPKDFLKRNLLRGKDVVLDIDVRGAMKLKKKYPQAIFIFLAPPSFSELERRIKWRKRNSEATIKKRLTNARWEMGRIGSYDYLVINDRLVDAFTQVKSIIVAEKSKVNRSEEKIKKLNLI
ncbi:guanylate kinase [bacterium]|nr:guanylate kinase [bacterium]NIN92354.1 guanylate kinase [bacterium]NIO18468.1 guanylate kinase [bacterium]NIO73464.1 guanylate kinase [bacterium]